MDYLRKFVLLVFVSLFVTSSLMAEVIIRDKEGRQVLFRGVNARVKGIFDVDFDDGRLPLERIPEFTENDAEELVAIGFNFIRLPINWSGIAPSPQLFNENYIKNILNFLDLCQRYHISVLLDMHQDAYSKEIGEDGAPDWAILPSTYKKAEGGDLGNLLIKRISQDTQKAFANFWKNQSVYGEGLQEHFISAMMYLLRKTANHPAVVGIEIFNEPWLLNIKKLSREKDFEAEAVSIDMLWQFYAKSISAIRAEFPEIWIYIEPDVTKSVVVPLLSEGKDQYKAVGLPTNPPWNTYKTVYAPHLYTLNFVLGNVLGKDRLNPKDPDTFKSINYSIAEANQIKSALMLGEFGFTHDSKNYEQTLQNILDEADTHFIHTAQWVWKESSQNSWGFWDYSEKTGYVFRNSVATQTARAYPSKINGLIRSFKSDRSKKSLSISLASTKRIGSGEHEVIWPVKYGYSAKPQVLCGPRAVSYRLEKGRLLFNCDQASISIN
jgi:hypothetical protein